MSRSEGSIDPDQRFTGQKLDPETGLYYYGGRYYDTEIGRFISADPFVQTPFDPQNLNRYSYVINNPQNYIDPDGYFHQIKVKKKRGFFGILFGAVIGFITGGPVGAFVGAALGALSDFVPEARGPLRVLQIIGGIGMAAMGNPAGLFAIASGAAGFCKGQSCQVASAFFGFAGGISGLAYASAGSGGGGTFGSGSGQSFDSGTFFSPAVFSGSFSGDDVRQVAGNDEGGGRGAILGRLWPYTAAWPTFEAAKRAMGNADPGYVWHHIVMRFGGRNETKFGGEAINNALNLVQVPKPIHDIIHYDILNRSAYERGPLVRDFIFQKSFAQQREIGIQLLNQFGIKAPGQP